MLAQCFGQSSCFGAGVWGDERRNPARAGVIGKIQMQTDKEISSLSGCQTLRGCQIAIIAAGEDDFKLGEICGLKRNHMRNLKDYLFLHEIVQSDPAGVVATVPGVYHHPIGWGLAARATTPQAQQEKPKTDQAHRLTDHLQVFIIQGYQVLREIWHDALFVHSYI